MQKVHRNGPTAFYQFVQWSPRS